jgi:proteic killer suppression protein
MPWWWMWGRGKWPWCRFAMPLNACHCHAERSEASRYTALRFHGSSGASLNITFVRSAPSRSASKSAAPSPPRHISHHQQGEKERAAFAGSSFDPDPPAMQLDQRTRSPYYRLTIVTRNVIIHCMIRSFRDRDTERLFARQAAPRLPTTIIRVAQRKLAMLDAASQLADLRVPPGNHLEQLTGNRVGQYSIRINDQWRICFQWRDGNAYEVEIVDYH